LIDRLAGWLVTDWQRMVPGVAAVPLRCCPLVLPLVSVWILLLLVESFLAYPCVLCLDIPNPTVDPNEY
jgi:hypothetical protein